MKFCGISLLTADVPKLVSFYSKVFGVEAEGDDIHSVINVGGLGIAIWHPDGLEERIKDYPKSLRQNCYTLMFSVDNVDKEYERLKKLNIEFTELPTTHLWGCRSFSFNDPDGNNIDVHMVLQNY